MPKTALRKLMSERRNNWPAAERAEKSRSITARVLESTFFAGSKSVFLYMSVGSEVETRDLAEAILAGGRALFVPRIEKGRMLACRIHSLARDLAPGALGILEPRSSRFAVSPDVLDLILAPGLAFDLAGHRLGYGGGYYDRFLPRRRPDAALGGLAFSFQILPAVPCEPHDQKLACLVSENSISYMGL
ncbi:MAG: 5-formyltetrahydrofolate cyclo-ligase [Gracilibacteraceae bacterium]|nr:5-formyltetrahydrofolate cyclo-ligase [Gracilibacteraceae bacterium]